MRKREAGKIDFGLILFIAILAAIIFFLFRYVPPRVNAMQFKEEMNKFNVDPDYKTRRLTEEQVQNMLYEKAQELKLPIEKKQIVVGRTGEDYKIEVSFQIPIDLKITTIYQKYDFKEPRNL
ncbi:MAG: hypothetical protein ACE14Q_04055 [Acidobacteriota bacterium]